MINNITDEERQALEQLRDEQQQQQQHRQSRTKRLAEMKSALRRSGEQPDEGRLRITTRGDAQELLMWALVRKVGDRAQWPDEYDQIAQWLSDNQGKGLMLIGDCGRGKSLITTEILPEMFAAGLIIDAQTHSKLADPFVCTARELQTKMKEALKHRVIIIDDVGTESVVNNFGTRTDYFSELVLEIDRPYRAKDGTMTRRMLICSTNLTKWELFGGDRQDYPKPGQITHYEGRYPDLRVKDRLRSMTHRIWTNGDSMRG